MGMSTDGLAIIPYLYSWAYEQEAPSNAHTYLAQFQDKTLEVRADNKEEAIRLVAHYVRIKNLRLIQVRIKS